MRKLNANCACEENGVYNGLGFVALGVTFFANQFLARISTILLILERTY